MLLSCSKESNTLNRSSMLAIANIEELETAEKPGDELRSQTSKMYYNMREKLNSMKQRW